MVGPAQAHPESLLIERSKSPGLNPSERAADDGFLIVLANILGATALGVGYPTD